MTSAFARSPDRRRRAASRRLAAIFRALAFVLAALVARPARAEIELRWEAPPECPQEAVVRERIRALAGPSLESAAPLRAEGVITRPSGRYRLRLRVGSGGAMRERIIESDGCADLAGAAAVALGLLVSKEGAATSSDGTSTDPSGRAGDPTTTAAGDEGKQGDPKATGAPSAATPPPTDEPPPASDATDEARRAATGDGGSGSRLNLLLRAPVLGLDLGPLPGPSIGVGAGAGVRYGAWHLVLSGRWFATQDIPASFPGTGVRARRLAADLVACRGFDVGGFELGPCLLVGLEHLQAAAFGEDVIARPKRAAWLSTGAGAVARWPVVSSLALVFGAAGCLEVSRPHLVIEELGEVDQLGKAALRTFVGTEWVP